MAIIFRGRVFTVMAKHLFSRNGVHCYQRRIPKDVAQHYRKQTKIVVPLGRGSVAQAAKEAARLAHQHEDLWATYRGQRNKGEREVRNAAVALLDRFGLKPGDKQRSAADHEIETMIDVFRDREIDPDRESYADGDEEAYQQAKPEDYLSPVKLEALSSFSVTTGF